MLSNSKKIKSKVVPIKKPRLSEQIQNVMRLKHCSLRTEQSYLQWIKRFVYFNKHQNPLHMGEKEVSDFLTHLAVKEKVSSATQNQALSATLFLYREVFKHEIGWINNLQRAKKSERIPVVFTREEAKSVLARLDGTKWLMASLLYGSGLRLMECLRLRIKDIDFTMNQIIIRDGKGNKDRVTMLPISLKEPLKKHLQRVGILHKDDLKEGFGKVYLPDALAKKHKNVNREWAWQYVFPASKRSIDPRTSIERRHHIYESVLQRAVKQAIRSAGINKNASCHTYRHSFAPLEI